MNDINEIKRLIAESEGVELSNWNTVTHAQREAWASIETQGRGWIIEFLTTIESQKEEMAQLEKSIRYLIATTDNEMEDVAYHKVLELMDPLVQSQREESRNSEIESLKAITELAVKGLEQVMQHAVTGTATFNVALSVTKQIEKLRNE